VGIVNLFTKPDIELWVQQAKQSVIETGGLDAFLVMRAVFWPDHVEFSCR